MIKNFFTSEFSKKSKFIWDFHSNIKEVNNWIIYASVFDNWINSERSGNKKNLIPKVIHHIWLGEKDLPPYFKKFKKSWQDNNPEYKFFLWNDEKCENLSLINRKLFDSIDNKGCKSDILRYEILYKYGGIYIDTDFECIRPIPDEFLKESFVACMAFDYKPVVNNAFLMSEPKTKLLRDIIKGCSYPENESTNNILKSSGPFMITKQISRNLNQGNKKILILPSNYCYPIPSFIKDLKLSNLITEDTFSIHHWATTWIKVGRYKKLLAKIKNIKFIFRKFRSNLNSKKN